MKKLFKYEINESIAAQATMNCLKNRNTHKIQEQEEGADDKETFALKLVKKFKNKMTPDYAKRPEMFMMLKLQKALKKPLMSLSKEEYHAWAKAICNACEIVFGSAQEQEEGAERSVITNEDVLDWYDEIEQLDPVKKPILDIVRRRLDADFIEWLQDNNVRTLDDMLHLTGWWGCGKFIKGYDYKPRTQEQEEHPEDADRLQSQLANAWDEGMEDDEDDYVPYENKFDETHHDIVDTILEEVYKYFQFEGDVEGFNLTEYTEEQIGKALEQIFDKTNDFPSSVSNNVCYAWVKKHAEEIMKILETGSLKNTYEEHPEFDFSEQEELPEMEKNDIKHALTQYLDESWIDASEDGDLEELYYAVSDYLDSTGDYPASADWEDCKPWCEKHYQDIETLFLGGGIISEQEEFAEPTDEDAEMIVNIMLDKNMINMSVAMTALYEVVPNMLEWKKVQSFRGDEQKAEEFVNQYGREIVNRIAQW